MNIAIHTVLILGLAVSFLAACDKGMERQHRWDMVRAENRCKQGYMVYCLEWAELQKVEKH